MNRKIAVAGTGYVGLSLAVLLAQKNQVTAVDIVPEAKYYTVKVKTCKNAGTYKVTIIGKGKYAGYTQTLTYKIKAKTQKVTLKSTDKYTVKASAVKKSSKTLKKAIKVTKKTGKISYTTNNSKIKVNKNGKIVVAKGTKKGTYQVKVTVKAKNYKTVNKYITVTVK